MLSRWEASRAHAAPLNAGMLRDLTRKLHLPCARLQLHRGMLQCQRPTNYPTTLDRLLALCHPHIHFTGEGLRPVS